VPLAHFAAIVGCMGLVSGLPNLEELWRCWRAEQKGRAGMEVSGDANGLFAA
jgi:hypothetical protein